MFTDNDELAGLIAAQINADKLIILSHIRGVFTKHPSDPESEFISLINPEEGWPEVSSGKSALGRGGMISKLGTARKMSDLGITTHIACIEETSVINRILAQEPLGTTVLPSKKKSNIKRWIAYNSDKKMGAISINPGLLEILQEGKRAVSILPVGIVEFSGSFKKRDLVEILSADGKKIGVGIAQYDAVKLSAYLGQKGKPEFIHYDYLHIF